MSWSRSHRRHQLVHEVLADLADRGRPELPARWQADVDAEFGGFKGFLMEVQVRWYRAFDARLDAILEDWPPDPAAALDKLWLGLADTMPAARFLLDAHLDHPALASLHARHQLMLYAATGIYRKPDDWPRPAPPPAGAAQSQMDAVRPAPQVDAVPPAAASARRRRKVLPCGWISAF
ncbi:hypothetical protein SMC26_13865 [Actinomadura fulvescens]|uniref:Uncharacterized protein n=1 Tax=Actinomadura fulvescens TaxID=46160 RepID=A0ABP6BX34_9ACTN